METPATDSYFSRHEFLIRRLHSLSGLIPVGAYMCVHLLTNATVLDGPETFQKQVDAIHGLGIVLPVVEWVFIFIPILFHGIIGVLMIRGMVPNTSSYPLSGNIRYTLQRATGMIAFAFIVWHVIHMHGFFGAPFKNVAVFPLPTGGAEFVPHEATSSTARALQAGIGVQILYAIGVLSCVFHLANGLWTMGITWGVWTTPPAQRRANYVCGAFGVGLAAVGLSALFGMSTTDIEDAQLVERVHNQEREERERRLEELRTARAKTAAVSPAAESAQAVSANSSTED